MTSTPTTATSRSPSDRPGRFAVVGNPASKRVALFQAALGRGGWPPAEVVAYEDLLADRDTVARVAGPGMVVRLESPGQDFAVERLLIAAGADEPEDEYPAAAWIDAAAALRLEPDVGRVLYPRQWYRGFRALLRRLAGEATDWMNAPADVAAMYDKPACQRRFAAAGLPVPRPLGPVGSFDDLLERMRSARLGRVFVKLAQGSSASGAVALAVGAGGRVRATTTAEVVRHGGAVRLYNSRRVRSYDDTATVAALIDALCREGVQAEEWVPKAGFAGHVCDLRVVVVAGRARQVVVRMSRTPMTNLHLLNRRGDAADLRREVGEERWTAALAACERAAGLFPASHYAGVDVLFAPGFRRHALLEINAFGDLLNGVLCDGRDAYETELAAYAEVAAGA